MFGTMKSPVNLKNRDNVPGVNCPIFKAKSNGGPGKMISKQVLKAILAAEQAAKEAAKAKKVTDDATVLCSASPNLTNPECTGCGPSALVVQDCPSGYTTCTQCGLVICDTYFVK